jgi:hypothetical protein
MVAPLKVLEVKLGTMPVVKSCWLLVCGFMLHWPMLQGRCWFVVLCFTSLYLQNW